MRIDWSFRAQDQLTDILVTIAKETTYENAVNWKCKIDRALAPLVDFPHSAPNIPLNCFHEIPPLVNRLHQIIIKPYRVVYEPVDEQCRVLAILHCRREITERDTIWDR